VKFEELRAKQKEAIIKWKNEKKNIFAPDCNSNISNEPNKRTDIYTKNTWKVRSGFS